jgi:hypothetical protein
MAVLYSIREHGQGVGRVCFPISIDHPRCYCVLLILGPTIGNVFSNLNSKVVTY